MERAAVFGIKAELRFGTIVIDPEVLAIRSTHGQHRIPPKHMGVLMELLRYAPAIVSREQLLQSVWPRGYVDPAVVGNAISSLRRVLTAHGECDVVETVPRRGYRMKAPRTTDHTADTQQALAALPVWPAFDVENRAVIFARGVELESIAIELAKQMTVGHTFVLIRVA